jgi:integrase
MHTVEHSKIRAAYVGPKGGKVRFGDFAEEVMKARALNQRASTRASDGSVFRSRVLPHFRDRHLGSVTPLEVQQWVTKTAKTHAASTTRKAYSLLASVFDAAVNADLIGRSPCRGIKLPQADRQEMRFLSVGEITRLADAVDPRYRALILTAAYTGARFGELAAVKVGRDGLDLLRRRLTVRATLTEVRGYVEVGPPKTQAANRAISLPAFLVDVLAHDLEDRHDEYVFSSPDGGPLRRNNFRRRVWLPALKAADLEGVRFHDLRHSMVALLVAQGEHPKVIASRLGHATVRTTLDTYGHLFQGLEAAADRLDATVNTRR